MIIEKVPSKYQPNYKSNYPSYSDGKNMEEVFYQILNSNKDEIETDIIYLPIFWTSFYITRNYGENILDLYDYLDSLDKTKKYFTIVQYASGIYYRINKPNIVVFSAGGGGLNDKSNNPVKILNYYGLQRHIFFGNKGDYDIPLMCQPILYETEYKPRKILCSFMGRFDTHKCRLDMKIKLEKYGYLLSQSQDFKIYSNLLKNSEFSLCPRGYGYTSFRLFEAIQNLSIPIYIWQDKTVLPFSDEVNWNKIAIIVEDKNMETIPELINKLTREEKDEMIENMKLFNKNYLSFEGTYEYIVRHICQKNNIIFNCLDY